MIHKRRTNQVRKPYSSEQGRYANHQPDRRIDSF